MATNQPVPTDTNTGLTTDQISTLINQFKGVATLLQQSPSISINTDIGAVANAFAEMCKLAQTQAGQQILLQWSSDAVKAETWIANAASSVVNFWKGLFK